MKKQYIFLIMIWIILYILYLIISFTYKEYKINSHIEYISALNQNIKERIGEAEKIIKYKSSLAYKNKVLKEQQSFKNKWENVVYLTTEKIYNKFTKEVIQKENIEKEVIIENSQLDNMNIYEKWIYFIFKK
jgi:cell shape-determining protein MreC